MASVGTAWTLDRSRAVGDGVAESGPQAVDRVRGIRSAWSLRFRVGFSPSSFREVDSEFSGVALSSCGHLRPGSNLWPATRAKLLRLLPRGQRGKLRSRGVLDSRCSSSSALRDARLLLQLLVCTAAALLSLQQALLRGLEGCGLLLGLLGLLKLLTSACGFLGLALPAPCVAPGTATAAPSSACSPGQWHDADRLGQLLERLLHRGEALEAARLRSQAEHLVIEEETEAVSRLISSPSPRPELIRT